MAEFLIRSGCSHHIDEIVRRAREKVWLISPFIKIADHLKELLNDKDGAGVDMRLVYGKSDLREGEREWLESLKSLRIYYRENLHAKCYMNEDFALITSMNLYEFSQINNDEWGILVSRQDDGEIYQEILRAANEIFEGRRTKLEFGAKKAARDSQPATARTSSAPATQTKTAKRPRKRTAERKPALPQTGVCIRDAAAIGFDILKPYCDKCFRSWNRYKNREYEELVCHMCGRVGASTMERPICRYCYLNVEHIAFTQALGDNYVPWVWEFEVRIEP